MRKSLQFKIFLLFTYYLLLATFLFGCGYTTKTLLPSNVRTIYVKPFSNKIDITTEEAERYRFRSYYPFLEVNITNEVIDRYIYDGSLRVVGEEDADIMLSGELIDYIKQPLRYSEGEEVEEYRISLVVNLLLKDLKQDKVIWEEKNCIGDSDYFTSGSLAKSEETALDDAIKDLARRIVERTVEGW